jgi:hypothetical protein
MRRISFCLSAASLFSLGLFVSLAQTQESVPAPQSKVSPAAAKKVADKRESAFSVTAKVNAEALPTGFPIIQGNANGNSVGFGGGFGGGGAGGGGFGGTVGANAATITRSVTINAEPAAAIVRFEPAPLPFHAPACPAPEACSPTLVTSPTLVGFSPSSFSFTSAGRALPTFDLELQQAMAAAIRTIEEAKDADAKRAGVDALQEILVKQFDKDMNQRTAALAAAEEHVKTLREQLEKRKSSQEEIIELRLRTIVNQANGLGFPGEFGFGFFNAPVPFQFGLQEMNQCVPLQPASGAPAIIVVPASAQAPAVDVQRR